MNDMNKERDIISQSDIDELLRINDFLHQKDENSLVSDLKSAILDSGKLALVQWQSLREHIAEIEELIPHIDLIIKLKKETLKRNRR